MSIAWIYLCIAIVAEVVATSALRAAEGFTHPIPTVLVVVGYVIAFCCLSLTLRDIPVGVAYAVWSGVGIVLVSVFAWFYYGQHLTPEALIGIALIIAGVVVVQVHSTSPH